VIYGDTPALSNPRGRSPVLILSGRHRGGDPEKFRKWYGSGRGRSYTSAPYAWRNQGGAVYAKQCKEAAQREATRFAPILSVVVASDDDGCRRPRSVAAIDAMQDASRALFLHGLRGLHPRVQQLCAAIVDGASFEEAARESGLCAGDLAKVLPRLRLLLS
jgi:hypothetical protein